MALTGKGIGILLRVACIIVRILILRDSVVFAVIVLVVVEIVLEMFESVRRCIITMVRLKGIVVGVSRCLV